MILWMILTILCSAAAVVVAAPFLRRDATLGATDASADISVYRDQLGEVDREAAAGAIDSSQAEAARAEIRRRLLSADRLGVARAAATTWAENKAVIVGVTGVVVLGSVILYGMTGRPDVPSAHGLSRPQAQLAQVPQPTSPAPAATSAQPAAPQAGPGAAQPGLASVDDMIGRIVQRLEKSPGNADDWRMLGWSYFGIERYAEAADAYGKAIALQPKIPVLHAARGEALVRAAQGVVTPEAKAAFEATHALDKKEPRARFFLGMAKEQAGDRQAALNDWTALVSEADPAEEWVPDLKLRIAELAQQMGVAVPAIAAAAPKDDPAKSDTGLAPLKPITETEPATAAKGPTAADVKAAEALAPGDRTAMIKGMVDSLAQRLENSPRDAEGWIKLMRSRKVLGEDEPARLALVRALEVFADAPAERAQIVAAAIELQIKP